MREDIFGKDQYLKKVYRMSSVPLLLTLQTSKDLNQLYDAIITCLQRYVNTNTNIFDKIYKKIISLDVDKRLENINTLSIDFFSELSQQEKFEIIKSVLEEYQNHKINIVDHIFKLINNLTLETSQKYDLRADELIDNIMDFDDMSKYKIVIYRLFKIFGDLFDDIYGDNYDESGSGEYRKGKIKFIKENIYKLKMFIFQHGGVLQFPELINSNGSLIVPLLAAFSSLIVDDQSSSLGEFKDSVVNTLEEFEEFKLFRYLKLLGVEKSVIENIFDQHTIKNAELNGVTVLSTVNVDGIIKNNGQPLDQLYESSDALFGLLSSGDDGFISFNPILLDLTFSLGESLFGKSKFTKLFKKYFYSIYRRLMSKTGGVKELSYNIYSYSSKNIVSKKFDGKEQVFDHHVVEWEIGDNFDLSEDLYVLGKMIKLIVPDFNLSISSEKLYDLTAIRTMSGEVRYKGMFVANCTFEASNLLYLRNCSTGERRLRLSLDGDYCGQEDFIFLLTQFSYYLKHKKFINKKQLYNSIIELFNRLRLKDQDIFDISVFEEQYERFIQTIIWPLSTEYFQKFGKHGQPMDTMLLGLYGTGKSQFMFNLLTRKTFNFKGRELHLNANVVSMNVIEFMGVISDDKSGMKKRLSDIYENTGVPLILVIEDLETIVNEENGNSDIITESMTNFFDGVGSIPITVVTSTNYPERFSSRLLRPNRVENFIHFDLPLKKSTLKDIINIHISMNGLENEISQDVFMKYIPDMKWFTSSHVASFIQRVKAYLDFQREFDSEYVLTDQDIHKIFFEVPILKEDIMGRQKSINRWLDQFSSGNQLNTVSGSNGIGF